jgi:UDP-glucose 4-epimerase
VKILVTGGAGFIGSNVVDAYIEAGHDVAVVDNLYSGKRENLNPGARFYQVDVRSEGLREVLEAERPDVVNHHAAQMSVPASVKDPAFDADVNVLGFINLLEAARSSGTRKVVFISSGGAMYGEADELPTPESCRPKPLSPYAITKLVSENYLAYYNHQYGLDYTVLRYANVYGPRQVPHGEAGVVAIFMDSLVSGKPCTLYFFDDEPRGMTRDYCFVGDVVRANILALTKGSREAFNIGTGVATHTLDLFNSIYRAIGAREPGLSPDLKEPGRGAARPGDLRASCLNVDKAAEGLGWRARVVLAEGLDKTVEWRLGQGK